MKKDYLLKPLLAMFMLMALAIPVQAIELTENFNSTRTDGGAAFDRYGTTTSFGTAGYDYTDWTKSGTVYTGKNIVRMQKGSKLIGADILADIPVGTEFTVQIWCAVWGTDSKSLTVSYGGSSEQTNVGVV